MRVFIVSYKLISYNKRIGTIVLRFNHEIDNSQIADEIVKQLTKQLNADNFVITFMYEIY